MAKRSQAEHNPSRAGRDALAVLLLLAVVGGLVLARHERLRRLAPAQRVPVRWVDPGESLVTAAPAWVDPRWLEHLEEVLADLGAFEVESPECLVPLAEELAALSFVERVERCTVSARDGLSIDLCLRRPVACIPVRGEFALVDRQGVVLEGRWPVPPRLGESILPVLGSSEDELLDQARPGDWLVEAEHTDALDVALSMAESLSEEQRAALGRVRIDARHARQASVTEPGVRLELEGGRQALFGRAPSTDAPGELAAGGKWNSLVRALALFGEDPLANDWELVDLRWDRPDLALRHPPEVAALTGSAPRPRGERAERAEPDPSRPQVR